MPGGWSNFGFPSFEPAAEQRTAPKYSQFLAFGSLKRKSTNDQQTFEQTTVENGGFLSRDDPSAKRMCNGLQQNGPMSGAPEKVEEAMDLPFADVPNTELDEIIAPSFQSNGLNAQLRVEDRYNNSYLDHFAKTGHDVMDKEMMDTEEATGNNQTPNKSQTAGPTHSQSVSPDTCRQFLMGGEYSPRQVLSYCRPDYYGYYAHCPGYPSDVY